MRLSQRALCYEATTAAHRRLPSRRQIAHRLAGQQAAVSSVWHALQHEPGHGLVCSSSTAWVLQVNSRLSKVSRVGRW